MTTSVEKPITASFQWNLKQWLLVHRTDIPHTLGSPGFFGFVSRDSPATVPLMVSGSEPVFSSVGVYDEPIQTNSVDFVAEGSTLSLSQFKSDVATAFNNDFGGVN